jgi:hypothetical protein
VHQLLFSILSQPLIFFMKHYVAQVYVLVISPLLLNACAEKRSIDALRGSSEWSSPHSHDMQQQHISNVRIGDVGCCTMRYAAVCSSMHAPMQSVRDKECIPLVKQYIITGWNGIDRTLLVCRASQSTNSVVGFGSNI